MQQEKKAKISFNTPIDADVLTAFRKYCKTIGIKMNYVLEAFMQQFTNGEFEVKLKKVAPNEYEPEIIQNEE